MKFIDKLNKALQESIEGSNYFCFNWEGGSSMLPRRFRQQIHNDLSGKEPEPDYTQHEYGMNPQDIDYTDPEIQARLSNEWLADKWKLLFKCIHGPFSAGVSDDGPVITNGIPQQDGTINAINVETNETETIIVPSDWFHYKSVNELIKDSPSWFDLEDETGYGISDKYACTLRDTGMCIICGMK